jgi:hypothetical protein
LDADEVVFLTMALRNMMEVASKVESEDLDLRPEDSPDLILTRVLRNGEWHDQWDPLTLPMPPPVPDYPDTERLQQLAESKPWTESVWEFGLFYLYTPVRGERGERDYFPVVALVVDRDSPLFLPQRFMDAGPSEAGRQELLVKLLAAAPGMPSEIVASTPRMAQLVESVTSPLGIELSVDHTPAVYDIRDAMSDFFNE